MHLEHKNINQEKRISVIIPTFNEEYSIKRVINLIPFKKLDSPEVFLIDGGSIDGTLEIAKDLGVSVKLQKEIGYGQAILEGISHAKGDILVLIDGDGVYDPREIPRFLKILESTKADLIIGSRFRGEVMPGTLPSRGQLFGNKLINFIYRLLYKEEITDAFSGFIVVDKKKLSESKLLKNLKTSGNVHIALIATVREAYGKIVEAPITFYPRKGKSKMSTFRTGFKILFSLLKESTRGQQSLQSED